MSNFFLFSDEYKLLLTGLKAALLVLMSIGISQWKLNLKSRSTSASQQSLVMVFSSIISIFLIILFLDVLYPPLARNFVEPLGFSFSLLLSNVFLLYVLTPHVSSALQRSFRRTLSVLSLSMGVIVFLNPIHQLITPISGIDGQLHWLLNIFLYYGVACLLVGFFIYFSFPKSRRDWNYGLAAIAITALYIISMGFSIPNVGRWDLFWVLIATLGYFILIFEFVSRTQRAPSYLKHLPIFERTDIIMVILGRDKTIKFVSQGATKHLDIFKGLDFSEVERADGELRILDKDDSIYQWSCHPLQNDYLITIENITDLMMALREKEKERDELERQQLVMGTHSSIEQEIERIQYRLQLLADVETQTREGMKQLRQRIETLDHEVADEDIRVIKLWSRYIKRRSLITLESNEFFPASWISLTAQQLLDMGFGKNFSKNINPAINLNHHQMCQLQDVVMDASLQLITYDVFLLFSVRPKASLVEITLLFQADDRTDWMPIVMRKFEHYPINREADSMAVHIELEVSNGIL